MEELLQKLAFNPSIHPFFSEYSELAHEYFHSPSRDFFYQGRMRKLLAASREHRDSYAKPTKEGIAVVHQFFPVRAGQIVNHDDFEQYLLNLSYYYKSKIPITLVESVQEYPFSAAHLLESGLVENVVFSWMNHGYLLQKQELPKLFGGCYGNHCVKQAMPEGAKKLSDIILEHPCSLS